MSKSRLKRIAAGAALAGLLLVACTPRQVMVDQFGAMLATGVDRLEQTGDVDLVESGLPGQITLIEALLASDPSDERLHLLLARLYAAQGLLFLEPVVEAAVWEVSVPWQASADPPALDQAEPQLTRAFQRGAAHALAVLEARSPGSGAQLANIRQIGPYLEAAGKADVPALFWYALNLGAWVNHHLDDLQAVAKAHVAERVMQRVIALEPDYYHGFAHLFLIAYYGSRPPMLGGNPEAARRHYEAFTQIPGAPAALAKVYYGRYCLPLQQARQRYLELMKPLAGKPIDVDTGFFDALAIRRAQLYLEAVDKLFE
ncbi:MAG: TRAP transporter TatT component family protein [Desulfosarcinaceae bacterium]